MCLEKIWAKFNALVHILHERATFLRRILWVLLNRPFSLPIRKGVMDIVALVWTSSNSTCICQEKHFLPCAAPGQRDVLWWKGFMLQWWRKSPKLMPTCWQLHAEECSPGDIIILSVHLLSYICQFDLWVTFAIVIILFYAYLICFLI